ncbi:hypothetical protein CEXT_667641 [Caerostris extrusa]|uniref:Uncharacterized protein n=1 Tax=Caerostris extrusa TaxID=172846 RepID=A0AAV4VBZ7_CAEEX|nr:hypothetical protein CEXT_667641 [Caerostris extrusa]
MRKKELFPRRRIIFGSTRLAPSAISMQRHAFQNADMLRSVFMFPSTTVSTNLSETPHRSLPTGEKAEDSFTVFVKYNSTYYVCGIYLTLKPSGQVL